MGFAVGKKREFSLYDVEQFLKEAGAERIHEKAVVSFEQELERTVHELVDQATFYANYAGRNTLIKNADIALASARRAKRMRTLMKRGKRSIQEGRLRRSQLSEAVEMILNQDTGHN